MAEGAIGNEGYLVQKRRRIHLDVVESVALSQSHEGSASLRQPIERKHPDSVSSNQGMRPWYRGHSHKRFQPPRRVDTQSREVEEGPRPSTSSIQGEGNSHGDMSENSTLLLGCKDPLADESRENNPDLFDNENEESEKDIVEQSSTHSVHLLSVLGGFQSAAAKIQNPSEPPCSLSMPVASVGSPRKTNLAGPLGIGKRKRLAKKQSVKDPSQSSILNFMSSSPSSLPSLPSSSSLVSSRLTTAVGCHGAHSHPHPGSDGCEAQKNDNNFQYDLQSKLCSPNKKVPGSDIVYVSSDDSSPDCSEDKCLKTTKLNQAKAAAKPIIAESGKEKQSSSWTSKLKLAASTRRQGKKKSKTSSNKRTSSTSPSVLSLTDGVNFDDDFVDGPASVPHVEQEVDVGKTYGLLNDSNVTVVDMNYFERLPLDVMENIFCRLPLLDLCLTANRVCIAWNQIISNPSFIPWKKTYHRLKLGEADAKTYVHKIITRENMKEPSLRLLKLISYMQKLKRVDSLNNACEMLKKHPKYTWALTLLEEKAPDCIKNKDPNPWSLVCAMVMVAASVHDLHTALQLLTSCGSHLTSLEVLECFYCVATFLLAFKQSHLPSMGNSPENTHLDINLKGAKQSAVVNGLHYRLFYALYLYENMSVSNHAMLQESMSSNVGQQSIVKYSRGDTEVRLTHEQMRIIKYTPDADRGEIVKIFAFAGTGKTTILVRYAQMRPHTKFLLIVFNKSVCTHAQSKFPPNVTCKTGHGLAFATVGRRYAAGNKLNPGNMRVHEIAMALEAREEHKENQYVRAKFVMETLKKYMSSDNDDITTLHVPTQRLRDDGTLEPIPHPARMRYAHDATCYWERMKNMRDTRVKLTHDGYLKLYQLTKPSLRQYDIILIDEAQDLTPALLDIVQRQQQPQIFVGDQHQQIYAFRGAINAMQGVQANKVFYLTQSFRFGPNIAHVANTMLEVLKGEHRKNIVGHAAPDTIDGEQIGQLAVLCRTNYTVFAEAVKLCVYSNEPIRVAFVGGLEGFGMSMLKDIYKLMISHEDRLKDGLEINNPFIRRFQSLGELEKYAEKTMDHELQGKIRIVKTYHHNLLQCIDKITSKSTGTLAMADVVLSTVHKAKGLEFSTVKITDDFLDFHDNITQSSIERLRVGVEDANLLYVAVTRAKHALIMSQTIRTMLSRLGGGCHHPVLTDKLKADGTNFICLGSKNVFKPQALTLYRPKVILSNKLSVPEGVFSPVMLSRMDSEYSHLFGSIIGDDFNIGEQDIRNILQVIDEVEYLF